MITMGTKMTEEEVLEVLRSVGAIITGSHVVYTSGKHGSAYINKDAVYPDTMETSMLCNEIAGRFERFDVDSVIAPAIGGVILSQWVAYHLTRLNVENGNSSKKVFGVYAEKDGNGDFVIKRGYDRFINGKRVLVVEDILTTGGSVKKVIEAVRAVGGSVVGLGVLCNRGGITPEDIGGVQELVPLLNFKLDSWSPLDCPLCKSNVPINTEIGKGREFLASKQA
jgi:orotate phosphoribosyltransferase